VGRQFGTAGGQLSTPGRHRGSAAWQLGPTGTRVAAKAAAQVSHGLGLSGGQRPVELPRRHAATRLPHGEACRGVAYIRHEWEA